MFKVFEDRNKLTAKLVQFGDNLGMALKENLLIFVINNEDRKVSYVSESGRIITATYDSKVTKLKEFTVFQTEDFMDKQKFDILVEKNIHSLLSNIYEDKYSDSGNDFTKILNLLTSRVKLNGTIKKLQEKITKVSGIQKIKCVEEYDRFIEVTPQLVTLLKESKNKNKKIEEIKNAVTLVYNISQAFDIPELSYDDLPNLKEFVIVNPFQNKIYEMICKQELIKGELIHNKHNFDSIWPTNKNIIALAGLIKSNNATDIAESLANTVTDVPYFALASKKQLTEIFDSILSSKGVELPIATIQNYSSFIFELKKPIREGLVNLLNQKYGINVLSLKEEFNFKSLAQTEVVIFESLARLAPKQSVLRKTLSEVANLMKNKSGVEVLSVASDLNEIFQLAGYEDIVESISISNYLDFDKIAGDLGQVSDILKMIKGMANQMQPQMGGGMPGQNPMGGQPPISGKPQMPMGGGMQPGKGAGTPGFEDDDAQMPPADNLGPEGSEEGMQDPAMGGGQPQMGMEPQEDDMAQTAPRNELIASMKDLEDLIASLKMDLGVDGGNDFSPEEGGFDPSKGQLGNEPEEALDGEEDIQTDEEMPEEGGEEGGEEGMEIDTGDGDDEVHIDNVKGEHNMDSDDEDGGEEEKPKSKPKPKEKSSGKDKKPNFKKKVK